MKDKSARRPAAPAKEAGAPPDRGAPGSMLSGPALAVRGVSKSFRDVSALQEITMEVRAGEVHCLLGENGAGKSTLLRIFAGLLRPDAGEILLQGAACHFKSPRDAIDRGIAMIHQELMPFPDLTVAENIFMGREPRGRLPGSVDHAAMERRARELLGTLGAGISPLMRMRDLRVSEIQVVEIGKALVRGASILIMDEPTSSLSHHESDALFRLIRDLRQQGVAIIYVSHRLDEIFALGDRATVLRDGRLVATSDVAALDETALITQMVGRPVNVVRRQTAGPFKDEILTVRDLGRNGKFDGISFRLHRGEVLGLAGLVGAGRTEVVSALYGLERADRGTIAIHGQPARFGSPGDAIRRGIGFVSEDRKQSGLVPGASIQHNLTLVALRHCCRRGMISPAAERAATDDGMRRYRIKAPHRDHPVGVLSGGNQQKVVIAKVLLAAPEILLLDEPTRGIDLGAKQEIYSLIAEWAQAGRAILLVSSELPELIALCDRIIVLRAGRIAAELEGQSISQEEILRHAMPA